MRNFLEYLKSMRICIKILLVCQLLSVIHIYNNLLTLVTKTVDFHEFELPLCYQITQKIFLDDKCI